MIRQEGVEDVISIICNLFDLVYRKVFYIWIKSILGDYEIPLYGRFFSSDPYRNGYWRNVISCIPIINHRRYYRTY